MATVRLTDNINKEIVQKAAVLFDDRIQAANVLPPELNTKDVYETWLDSEVGLRADVEIAKKRGWFTQVDSLKLKTLNKHDIDIQLLDSTPGVFVPYAIGVTYGGGLRLKGERATQLYEIFQEWRENIKLIRQQRDTFKEQITNLLMRHKTLKQALGEWPALWDFVPSELKAKHNEEKEKSVRETKDDDKPAVDLDVLNGAVVTAKILKGGFGS